MKREYNIVSVNDIASALNDVIEKKVCVSIDTHIDKPVMLLNRIRKESAYIVVEKDRLIIQAADKYRTHLININMEMIQNIQTIIYSDKMFQVIFELKNMSIKYKITIER